MTDYAMYKGDKFIDIDTIPNLAEKYHKTESALKYLSYPSAHKKSHGNSLLLYEIEDDEQNDINQRNVTSKKFDLKLGAATTPHELSTVFQYSFMRYSLGVNYDSFSKKYIIRTQGGESFNADGSTKIVYLGFGEWKNERGDIDEY